MVKGSRGLFYYLLLSIKILRRTDYCHALAGLCAHIMHQSKCGKQGDADAAYPVLLPGRSCPDEYPRGTLLAQRHSKARSTLLIVLSPSPCCPLTCPYDLYQLQWLFLLGRHANLPDLAPEILNLVCGLKRVEGDA